MTPAAPGPATEAVRGHAPSAGSHGAPADPLIAALFDAALEVALGEIDATRAPRDELPDALPAARTTVAPPRDGQAGDRVAREDDVPADPWLAMAAWRQELPPNAVPVLAPPAPASTAATGRAAGATTALPRVDARVEIRADVRVDAALHENTPSTAADGAIARAASEVAATAGVPDSGFAQTHEASASATTATAAAGDERKAARPAEGAAPAIAPSPAAWVAAPATAAIAVPIDSPGFAPALADQVVRLVTLKMDRIELAVHPAELGPIGLSVAMNGGDVQVVVTAVQPEARAALEQSLPDLRSLLQGAGIALGEASVHDGRTSRDDARAPAPAVRESHADEVSTAAAPLAVLRRGLVDLYA